MIREHVGSSRGAVPYHDGIDEHRFDCLGRVNKGLSFGDAGAARGEFDRIGTQAFRGEREAIPRARTVFKKQVRDGSTFQQIELRPALIGRSVQRFSEVENERDFIGRQMFQTQQVFVRPVGRNFR